MPEMELVKTAEGKLRGYRPDDEEAWQRWKRWVDELEPGEFFHLKYTQPRNYRFHKKFFAMLNHAFEHWEPERSRKRKTFKGRPIEKNFDQFRKDMLILAGFGVATYESGPRGRVRVRMDAKSIAFGNMTEEDFQKVYDAVFNVLHREVMTNYTREDFADVVQKLEGFG